ncbi:MAG: DUF551 domain-containing protein [Desulfuromonadales bacterium]|nr:DUF551 domain-containing protein [Desulfuromonadales bacterium]
MEWISIHEQLPSEEERVLLYTPENVFGDDHACVGTRAAILSCQPLFTHWLPLPDVPFAATERCCFRD